MLITYYNAKITKKCSDCYIYIYQEKSIFNISADKFNYEK
jgi:hypothetical protein